MMLRRHFKRALGVACAAAALSGAAHAQTTQSNGTVIPVTNHLVTFLNAAGETINPLTDAATTPETFKPGCQLTFTVIGRGAAQKNSFGWYNVTGQKPALSELVEFIGCNDGVGTVKVLDIKADPRYRGGEIGFFEATTEGHTGFFQPNCVNLADPANTLGHVFYSEKKYNEDNAPTGPSYVHLLTMDSKVRPNTFYFGWEDLFQGGDNDFEDLLTRVEGIQCSGGGTACDSGSLGACSAGVMQCKNGVLTCVQSQHENAEKCNAIDDDCNGQVDDGDLCQKGEICDHGTCIHRCGGAEFPCSRGLECRGDGYCVDPRCDGVTCAAGEVCALGVCRGACDGVACPFGQVCRSGACIDSCAGKECDPGQICDRGVCISCLCGGCPGGNVCNQTGTLCVPPDCVALTCGPGLHCALGGTCVDDCAGAVCPSGETCRSGECLVDANPSAGAGGASPIFSDGSGGAAPGLGAGGVATPGAGGASLSTAGAPGDAPPAAKLGCGCRMPGGAGPSGSGPAALGMALAVAATCRRRRERVARRQAPAPAD
jgi:hypothetical protein